MVEPCLLAREIEVALDIDAASFILPVSVSVVKVKNRSLGARCSVVSTRLFDVTRSAYVIGDPVIAKILFFDVLHPFASFRPFNFTHLYSPGLELQS